MSELKQYLSHKKVHAEPMTYSKYCVFRHENPTLRSSDIAAEKDAHEGFHMVYKKDTADEYHSWQPKYSFDEGYSKVIESDGGMRQNIPILKYFKYDHLPKNLQEVSKFVGLLAVRMDDALPCGPEKSAGLRKLLEAKDCFVRANLK